MKKWFILYTKPNHEIKVAEQLEAMFEPSNHIGVSGEIVDECVALARQAIQ